MIGNVVFRMQYLTLLSSFMLAACASGGNGLSQSEVSGPASVLLVESSIQGLSTVQVWGNAENCTKPVVGGWIEQGQVQTLKIPAGAPITVTRSFSTGFKPNVSCSVVLTFIPKEERKYKSVFKSEGGKCSALVLEEVAGGSQQFIPVEVRQRKLKKPFFESDGFCE